VAEERLVNVVCLICRGRKERLLELLGCADGVEIETRS